MREKLLKSSNYLLFIIFAIFLAAAQASLWFNIFGSFPAPMLWLLVLSYWALYRNLFESILMNYLLTFIAVTLTSAPLSVLFASHLSLMTILILLRDRVLWSGLNSYILACGLSAALLPLFNLLWSYIFEPRPINDFQFYEWVIQTPLTAIFATPAFMMFSLIDHFTQNEAPKDSESEFI